MIFALGFACGLILGLTLAWLSLTWMHPVNLEETGTFLFPMSSSHAEKSTFNRKQLNK